ncbi:MAG: anthranilate synthase component I family protein [Gemmatimonadota bacterium]
MLSGPPLIHELSPGPDLRRLAAEAGEHPFTLWLDSALPGSETGRYSFLAVDPYRALRCADGASLWLDPDGERDAGSVFTALSEALYPDPAAAPASSGGAGASPYPFQGGAAGFFGYELGGQLETVPRARIRDTEQPDLEIGFYDIVIGLDHQSGRGWVCSTGLPHTGPDRTNRARNRLDAALAWIAGGEPPSEHGLGATAASGGAGRAAASQPPALFPLAQWPGVSASISGPGYQDMVRRAVELIRAGDVFQANVAQRLEISLPSPSGAPPARDLSDFELYSALRERTPAPFAAFFRASGCSILSASPERFLRVRDRHVETRPIKGTRPRGRGAGDARLAAELLASEKDRAENLMIVDLLRNDLSRVCTPGSIRVSKLFGLESYATVHHMVSVVEGALSVGQSPLALLQACFPGGSVTGAPKIRAMEIIADLEPVERGPYCGAVGYVGFDGSMDLSIAIRTAVRHPNRITFHAGGAVVADSDPEAEYVESLDKVAGLAEVLSGAALSGEGAGR